MEYLNIVDLDIYVLDSIFRELDELGDQLNLAEAHPILREAFLWRPRRNSYSMNIFILFYNISAEMC